MMGLANMSWALYWVFVMNKFCFTRLKNTISCKKTCNWNHPSDHLFLIFVCIYNVGAHVCYELFLIILPIHGYNFMAIRSCINYSVQFLIWHDMCTKFLDLHVWLMVIWFLKQFKLHFGFLLYMSVIFLGDVI